jgi:hypothetical protein
MTKTGRDVSAALVVGMSITEGNIAGEHHKNITHQTLDAYRLQDMAALQ